MTKKNILLIYADQWRQDQFGVTRSRTPNIDALADEAVSFTRHYTQAIPCSPARASLFTGLYTQTHGVYANGVPLDRRHVTLAQYLRRAGYAPTLFGYTDTALDPRDLEPADPQAARAYNVLPGCDTGCHLPSDAPNDWLAHLRRQGLSFSDVEDVFRPDLSKPSATGGAGGHSARYKAADSDTAYLTDRFLSWEGEQKPGWCALLCYLRPHPPTIAPEPWNSAVDPADLAPPSRHQTPEDEARVHAFMAHQIASGVASSKCSPGLAGSVADVAETDWRSLRAIHLALMSELDANLGRVVARLKEAGQWDDTLVLFSSDHGEMMFDHHLCNQASWHEQCAHVPLILRIPEAWAREVDGTTVDSFTGGIDTIPTLLDWLGLDVPRHLDGQSLLPLVRTGGQPLGRDAIQWEYHFREMAEPLGLDPRQCMMSIYRDAAFKHVWLPGQAPVLIDLKNDPQEMNNLAEDPAHRRTEREYLARQVNHFIQHRDRVLDPHA